jgi:hypothetical protein
MRPRLSQAVLDSKMGSAKPVASQPLNIIQLK